MEANLIIFCMAVEVEALRARVGGGEGSWGQPNRERSREKSK